VLMMVGSGRELQQATGDSEERRKVQRE
jgi:hypothetical protein